jgi:hypothetical protein
MPSQVTLTGGPFTDAQGTALANGYLTFELNQDESVVGTAQLCAGSIVKITLDGSGNIASNQSIWGNDQMTPVNSYYLVRGYSSAGQLAWGPNAQQVTGSSPFSVSTWVPSILSNWTPSLQSVTLQTNEVNNGSQSLLDLHAGSNITLTDNGSGRVTIASTGGGSVSPYFGNIPTLTSPGPVGNWTWVNQGGATASVSNGGIYMKANAVSNTHSLRALVITAPATPYEYVLAAGLLNPATTNWDALTGFVFRESSSGKLTTVQLENDVENTCGNFQFTSATFWNSPTAPVSDQVLDYYRIIGWSSPPLLRCGDDGTNRYGEVSMDGGNNWLRFMQQARTANMTADQIGWFADVFEGAATSAWHAMLMSWVRTI